MSDDRDLDLDLWLCTRCKDAPAEPGENHCGACDRELEEIEPRPLTFWEQVTAEKDRERAGE